VCKSSRLHETGLLRKNSENPCFCLIFLQDGVGVDERRLCSGDAGVGQRPESGLADFERPCTRRSLGKGAHEVMSTSDHCNTRFDIFLCVQICAFLLNILKLYIYIYIYTYLYIYTYAYVFLRAQCSPLRSAHIEKREASSLRNTGLCAARIFA